MPSGSSAVFAAVEPKKRIWGMPRENWLRPFWKPCDPALTALLSARPGPSRPSVVVRNKLAEERGAGYGLVTHQTHTRRPHRVGL